MRIALTGGAGFIGHHITDALAGAGHDLRLLVHNTVPEIKHDLDIVKGDLTKPDDLKTLVKDMDCVIHCAGLTNARNKDDFFTLNTHATQSLLEIVQDQNVKKFLFISSLAAKQRHLSPYAQSKADAETFIKQTTNMGWDCIRPPAVYGPGDQDILIFLKLLKKRIAPYMAPKDARLSMIYVEDLANAVLKWVEANQTTQSFYELDDGKDGGYSWDEVYSQIGQMVAGNAPISIRFPRWISKALAHTSNTVCKLTNQKSALTPDKLNELFHSDWVCASSDFSELMQWKPQYNLDRGMKKTISWYEERNWL